MAEYLDSVYEENEYEIICKATGHGSALLLESWVPQAGNPPKSFEPSVAMPGGSPVVHKRRAPSSKSYRCIQIAVKPGNGDTVRLEFKGGFANHAAKDVPQDDTEFYVSIIPKK